MARRAEPPSLELHEPEGAFRRIEEWLREHGFFVTGGEELVADLYLGYGLSETIRHTSVSSPPEPCLVWDSDPAAEVDESWTKERLVLDLIGAGRVAVERSRSRA
ncbi:MAG: hypothetical protein ACRELC_00755 [Gemmatimonadota bacterium]